MAFTSNRPTNWTILIAALCALIVAGWYLSNALGDVGNYMDWDKNKQYSTMFKAGVLGFVAFLLACGVDVKALLGPLGSFLPGTTTTVTETAKKETITEVKVEENKPKTEPTSTGG